MNGLSSLVPRLVGWVGLWCVLTACTLGGCGLESAYYHPDSRSFDTPAGVEDLRLSTADGVGLHAWFVPAPRLESGASARAPVVIVCPGSRTQIDELAPLVRPLGAKADASLLLLSYRGYGRSDPVARVTREGTVRDALAAVDAALRRPDVDPEKIAVLGYSIGGIPALAVAAERPEIRCVVVGGTYATARLALEDHEQAWAHLLIGDDHDPQASAARLGPRPLMVFHGRLDGVIPPYHALLIAAAAMRQGTPVSLRIADNAGHRTILEDDPGLLDAIATFLGRAWALPRSLSEPPALRPADLRPAAP